MALRTIAARPRRALPTSRSFAESGTGRYRESAIASEPEAARINTGDATTEADGAATTPVRAYLATGCGSIDRAYPTGTTRDRKSTRLNSSHSQISYAVVCLQDNSVPRPI